MKIKQKQLYERHYSNIKCVSTADKGYIDLKRSNFV